MNRQTPIIALEKWLEQLGRTHHTGYNWRKRGWIHPINIAGRLYMTAEDIDQFLERAKKGDFSQTDNVPPRPKTESLAFADASQGDPPDDWSQN